MKKLRNFFRSSFAEKFLIGESLFLVAFISLILRIVPFKFFNKSLSKRLAVQERHEPIDWNQIKMIVRSVRFVSRFVPFATCLTQALAALYLIRSKGQHSELKLGVCKDEKQHFKAHAWLETNGRIIIGKIPSHREYIKF